MGYSLCSYSVNRTFTAGKMDIFGYMRFCKEAGFTQLDPWSEHLKPGYTSDAFLYDIKDYAQQLGLPFGCIAVDGAHIWEPTAEGREEKRQRRYRWLEMAAYLGAQQMRIDAGGNDQVTADEIFPAVVDGYNDLIGRARKQGVEIIIENHWGPFQSPDELYKLLDAVPHLGLLFDSYNWPEGTHVRAWQIYAKYARLTHFKTFSFDAEGNDPEWDIARVIYILQDNNYQGTWGIESTPYDGDELGAAVKSLALLKRLIEQ